MISKPFSKYFFKYKKIINFLIGLIGFVGLFIILNNYGFESLWREFDNAGLKIVLLILTFIPTLFCYSIAWLIVTKKNDVFLSLSFKNAFNFFKMTTISIAWNNLTPFLKVGGEPAKYFMLQDRIDSTKSEAIHSTVIYNVVHLYGTILSMVIAAVYLVLNNLLDISRFSEIHMVFFVLLLAVLFILPFFLSRFIKNKQYQNFVLFFLKNKVRALFGVLIECIARFVEGITFYFAFLIIEKPIQLIPSLLLEVARTFIDTVFFFVPFQLGTREKGIDIFIEKFLKISGDGVVSAVLLYRFVEIAWIFIGYFLWHFVNKKYGKTGNGSK